MEEHRPKKLWNKSVEVEAFRVYWAWSIRIVWSAALRIAQNSP